MPKHILRRLLRSPLFAAMTLITLAVGIGANTAIFSIVSGILVKPLPYSEADRLVGVWQTAPGLNIAELNASPSTYFTYREEGRTFEDIGLWRYDSVSVTGIAEPEQVPALFVTDGTLPVLGVGPARGRWFTRHDDAPDSPMTVMLMYGYWQRRFGGDPSVIGRRLMVDGKVREVIGIMPQRFRFMNPKAALIIPLQINRAEVFLGSFGFQAVARLKPGVTMAQANADVARMIPLMALKFQLPSGLSMKMWTDARIGPNVRPLARDVVGDIGGVLWILMGTVGIVLLIACANVANLLLVRVEGRRQELAIRAALGAGSGQIARELLYESVALALAGGALGLGLAYAALRVLVAVAPANLPRLDEITIDTPVLLFTFGVSLIAGVLFGLVPVFKYAAPQLGSALRDGSRTVSEGRERHRVRSVLVVVQVALALVLLISSGLMIRTLRAMKQVDPGFTRADEVLTLRVSVPSAAISEPERVVRTYQLIAQSIAAIPGVTATGLSQSLTMDGNTDNDPVFVEDHAAPGGQLPPIRRYKFIAPGFFKTVGRPLEAGRDLSWTDIYSSRPVVMVSDNFAREYWHTPGAALGKRLRESPTSSWREIIGVVGNEHDDGVERNAPAVVYWPMLVHDFWGKPVNIQRGMAFAVRSTRTGSAALFKEVEAAVWSVMRDVPIADVRTMQEIYDKSMVRTSFMLVMLAVAAGMALLLGLIGVYGVISYSVSQRTREIGIRMALGAPESNVRRMFVRHGLILASVGVACGMGVAIGLTRAMSALLFGVSPMDPVTYGAVATVLLGAALLASYIPARRATVIDPVQALRAE